jgi:ferric-dicitrate binding protein FerR (iron transport regulator)
MKDKELYEDLILRYLDGNLLPDEKNKVADLLRNDPEARTFLREIAEQAVTVADMERVERSQQRELEARQDWVGNQREALSGIKAPRIRFAGWPWAVAAAACVALIASVVLLRPKAELEIVRITELNGAVRWTGSGGQVVPDLYVGSSMPGGTLESLSADSWIGLEFRDGSTVTASGQSVLTISEYRQKELHLHIGSLSASIMAQSDGKPMLIYTPTARLEVLGTQLNVEAGPSSTMLSVNKGRVRVTRLADGSVAEVPADHQVVASVDHRAELKVIRRPRPVAVWQSDLPTDGSYGKWLLEPSDTNGTLRTAPLLWGCPEKPITLYVVALSVSRSRSIPVVLTPGGKLRIHGRIKSTGDVYFGFTTRQIRGGFAGKFLVQRHFEVVQETGESLDIELRLEDFRPQEQELIEKFPEKFPDSPIGLELLDWWCCTINEDAGLEITHVELDAGIVEVNILSDDEQI